LTLLRLRFIYGTLLNGTLDEVLGMTVKVELTPEIEAGLLAQAQARGMSLEVYAAELLQRAAAPLKPRSGKKSLVDLFVPLRGLNLDFGRNPSAGRPVDL
jgi:hypothetical protein